MADSVKIRIIGDASEFNQALQGVGQDAKGMFGDIGKVAAGVFSGSMIGDMVKNGCQALVDFAKQSVTTYMTFDAAMSEVAAISGATGDDLQRLTETAKYYGATTAFTATQSAEALKYMALAGWDAQQAIDALPGVLNLAASSGMELGAASDAVTDYLSAFGMQASDASYMADMMSYAQANANTSATQLADAYGNCASSMHGAGQDIETTTALLMTLSNQGIKGSEAGTQLSAMVRDMTQKMEDGKIMIGDTAIEVMDAAGNFRDLNAIIADVGAATSGMGTAQKSAALMTTFTARSVKSIQTILNAGVDSVDQYEEALRMSEGTAAAQSEIMLDNLQGDLQIFNSALEGVQISTGQALNGVMRNVVQIGTGLLNWINGGLTAYNDAVAAEQERMDKVHDRIVKKYSQEITADVDFGVKDSSPNVSVDVQLTGQTAELNNVKSTIDEMMGTEYGTVTVDGDPTNIDKVIGEIRTDFEELQNHSTVGVDGELTIDEDGLSAIDRIQGRLDQLKALIPFIEDDKARAKLEEQIKTLESQLETLQGKDTGGRQVSVSMVGDGEEKINKLKETADSLTKDGQTYGTVTIDGETTDIKGKITDLQTAIDQLAGDVEFTSDGKVVLTEGDQDAIAYIQSQLDGLKALVPFIADDGERSTLQAKIEEMQGLLNDLNAGAECKVSVIEEGDKKLADLKQAAYELTTEPYGKIKINGVEADIDAELSKIKEDIERVSANITITNDGKLLLTGSDQDAIEAIQEKIGRLQTEIALYPGDTSALEAKLAWLNLLLLGLRTGATVTVGYNDPNDAQAAMQDFINKVGELPKDETYKVTGKFEVPSDDMELLNQYTEAIVAAATATGDYKTAVENMNNLVDQDTQNKIDAVNQQADDFIKLEAAKRNAGIITEEQFQANAAQALQDAYEQAEVIKKEGERRKKANEVYNNGNRSDDFTSGAEMLGETYSDVTLAETGALQTSLQRLANQAETGGDMTEMQGDAMTLLSARAETAQRQTTAMSEAMDTYTASLAEADAQEQQANADYAARMEATQGAQGIMERYTELLYGQNDAETAYAKTLIEAAEGETKMMEVAQAYEWARQEGADETEAWAQTYGAALEEIGEGSAAMQQFRKDVRDEDNNLLDEKQAEAALGGFDDAYGAIEERRGQQIEGAATKRQSALETLQTATEEIAAMQDVEGVHWDSEALRDDLNVIQQTGAEYDEATAKAILDAQSSAEKLQGLFATGDLTGDPTEAVNEYVSNYKALEAQSAIGINVEGVEVNGDVAGQTAKAMEEATDGAGGETTVETTIVLEGEVETAGNTGENIAEAIEEATDGAGGETVVEPTVSMSPKVDASGAEQTRQALVAALQSTMAGTSFDSLLESSGIAQTDFDAMAKAMGFDGTELQRAIEGTLSQVSGQSLLSGVTFDGVDLSALTEPVGEGVTEGVTTGIESTAGEAADASGTMARDAAEAAGPGAQVNSPSAITIPVGEGIAEGVTTGIQNGSANAVSAAQGMGRQAAEAVATGLTGAQSSITDAASGAIDSAITDAVSAAQEAASIGEAVDSEIANGIDNGAGTVGGAAQSMVSGAVSSASGAAHGASSIGSAMAQGIASGISSGRSAVVSAAIQMAQSAINAAKAALSIASPSKVTYGFGEMFDKGMEQGILEHTRGVVRSAVDMANSAAGAANLTPRLDFADMKASVRGALNDFASIENNRDVVLAVNGRELARTTASDTLQEQNAYNRRLAANYGTIRERY